VNLKVNGQIPLRQLHSLLFPAGRQVRGKTSYRNNGEKVRNKNLFILVSAHYFAQRMKRTEDTYQHKGMRRQLINLLREKGIGDEQVLEAMNNIPRHWFLDSAFNKIAYEDRAFPIGEGQTISQPYTVAYRKDTGNRHRQRLPGNCFSRNGCACFYH
jgi:hypothetical protein